MLIVISNSPIAVSLIIIAAIRIIHRPYRRHHQCRLHNTIRSGSIYPIGSRIGRREIQTKFQSFIFPVQIHTHTIFLKVGINYNTLFIIIVGRNEIADCFSSAGNRNIVAGSSSSTKNSILPIRIRQPLITIQIGKEFGRNTFP